MTCIASALMRTSQLSSHQLWHLFVFMAVVFHYENTLHIFSTIPLRDCVPWPAL